MTEAVASSVTLFDYARSPASQRVRIALNLKGIACRRVTVDLGKGEQSGTEHLARNPQGSVLVLDIDGGGQTQSLAIIEYLEETRPTPRLLPAAVPEKVRVRQFAHALATDISPLHNLLVSQTIANMYGAAEERAWLIGHLSAGLVQAETLLRDAPEASFCFGAEPSLADCVLFPQVRAAWRWGIDFSGVDRVAAIFRRCCGIPAFSRILDE